MRKFLVVASLLFAGCQSTNPRIDYINNNGQAVTDYQNKHGGELDKLSRILLKKCFFDEVDKKNNLGMVDLIQMTPKGIVTLKLDDTGKVVEPLYETNVNGSYLARNLKSCIEAAALNYKLPKPNTLEYIFLKFKVELD
jgi:hypothetical protein